MWCGVTTRCRASWRNDSPHLARSGPSNVRFARAKVNQCGGRLRHVATLQSPAAIRRILKHLSLWTEEATAPPRAPPTHEADEVALADIWEDEEWSQDPDDYAAEA